MMSVFRSSIAALGVLLISVPAMAQSAPIRIGPGGSTYSTEADAQSQLARQSTRITDLEAEISRLTGRIEQLEFRLTSREQAYQDAMETNRQMDERLIEMNGRMAELEQWMKTRPPGANGRPLPSDQRVPGTGPRDLSGGPAFGNFSENEDDPSAMRTETRGTFPMSDTAAPVETNSSTSGRRLPEGTLGTLPASRLPGQAGPLFQLGKNRLLNFDYAGAERAFTQFLNEFGDEPEAGEAHYWLGEVLYQQGDYAGSARFLTTFVRDYTDDPRRGEGVVKLARALREIGQEDTACQFLSRLNQVDPDASERTIEAANVQRQLAGCN